MSENKKVKFEKSSGNIYADLGFSNSKEMLRKARVAMAINKIIETRGLKQKEAAKILNIDQPKISALKNGRLSGFSLDRLFSFLDALNYNVEIRITDKHHKQEGFVVYEHQETKEQALSLSRINGLT